MAELYNSPQQFEPLLPAGPGQAPLLERAHELARTSAALSSQHAPIELRALLRAMNSYYSNRIEGQHTRPRELEQALRKDFSANAQLAARQRLAIAHIDAEVELESRYVGDTGATCDGGCFAQTPRRENCALACRCMPCASTFRRCGMKPKWSREFENTGPHLPAVKQRPSRYQAARPSAAHGWRCKFGL